MKYFYVRFCVGFLFVTCGCFGMSQQQEDAAAIQQSQTSVVSNDDSETISRKIPGGKDVFDPNGSFAPWLLVDFGD